MSKKNIEFTEDAIRQKIELSPIEKYIKFGTILPLYLNRRKVPLESCNLRWTSRLYDNSSDHDGSISFIIPEANAPDLQVFIHGKRIKVDFYD